MIWVKINFQRIKDTIFWMLKYSALWMILLLHLHLVSSSNRIEGSGDVEQEKEYSDYEQCYPQFRLFDQRYLKGVNKPFYTAQSKNISLAGCMELCCIQSPDVCKSFSYFLDLNVCYLMNVTQYDNFAVLQPAISFKHYHRLKLCTNQQVCKNGGTCLLEVNIKSGRKLSKCQCAAGYTGLNCEHASPTKGSIPSYIIVVAILGALFILLLFAVLITYLMYRRRSGRYQVKKRREEWKKTPQNS